MKKLMVLVLALCAAACLCAEEKTVNYNGYICHYDDEVKVDAYTEEQVLEIALKKVEGSKNRTITLNMNDFKRFGIAQVDDFVAAMVKKYKFMSVEGYGDSGEKQVTEYYMVGEYSCIRVVYSTGLY